MSNARTLSNFSPYATAVTNIAVKNADLKAGTTAFFAMSSPPNGWLKANGASISRTVYADLFAAIGITYGSGDGSTTFTLPDLRGEFMRAWDDGRGADGGRSFATAQGMDWKGFYVQNVGQNTYSYTHGESYWGKSTTSYGGNTFGGYWAAPASSLGAKWDTSEVRPRNVCLLACIKF